MERLTPEQIARDMTTDEIVALIAERDALLEDQRRLRTKDHPEALGRSAKLGERGYTLTFPLESGEDLVVLCGDETFQRFSDMIGRMIIDDDTDAARKESDGSH